MYVLDSFDTKILRSIRNNALSVSGIARKTGIGRTTIAYRLKHLLSHHLVGFRQGVGVEVLWCATQDSSLGKSSVCVYTGTSFRKGYTAMWKMKKGSVVFVVHGTQAVEAEFKQLPRSFILSAQQTHRRRQTIFKSIIHESVLEVMKHLNERILRAHANRASANKSYVSSSLFRGSGEVIVARTFVLMVDVKGRRSVLIRNKHMVAIVYDMASMLFDLFEHSVHAKGFDFQKIIQGELARRSALRASYKYDSC